MLRINFYKYFVYTSHENFVLSQQSSSTLFNPKFTCKFYVKIENKLEITQTFFLLKQFFGVRPFIRTIKRQHKPVFFIIGITSSFADSMAFFSFVRRLRYGAKRKLVSVKYKENGYVYVAFKDFVTLFPFVIGTFDFHNWRRSVTLHNLPVSGLYQKNLLFNFYNYLFI